MHDAYEAFEAELEARMRESAGEPKPWYASRAMWGGLVTAGAGVAGLAGYAVDSAALTDLVIGGVTLVGGVLAWVGRAQATRPIRKL